MTTAAAELEEMQRLSNGRRVPVIVGEDGQVTVGHGGT